MTEGLPAPIEQQQREIEEVKPKPIIGPNSSRLGYIRERVKSIREKQRRDTERFGQNPENDPNALRIHRAVEQFGLEEKVSIDELTGLLKPEPFRAERNRLLGTIGRDADMPSVQGIRLDLDKFGDINKIHGQRRGDEVLRQIGECLIRAVRGSDIIGRIGGEEFEFTAPRTNDAQRQSDDIRIPLSEKVRKAIQETKLVIGESITASIGVTEFVKGEDISSYEKRLENAQVAAKRLGRNRVVEARLYNNEYIYLDHSTGKKYKVERDVSGKINDPIEID